MNLNSHFRLKWIWKFKSVAMSRKKTSSPILKSLGVDMTQYMLHPQPRYKINQEVIVGPSPSNVYDSV